MSRKLKTRLTAALAALALVLIGVAKLLAAEAKTINVGWTGGSAWTALPDRIAVERGFFEKEGLRVRHVQFQGTNLMLSALLANEAERHRQPRNRACTPSRRRVICTREIIRLQCKPQPFLALSMIATPPYILHGQRRR